MLFIKMAAVTCAFYLGVAILMQAGLFVWARLAGSAAVFATRWGWTFLWGIVWFVSFNLAWHFGRWFKIPI